MNEPVLTPEINREVRRNLMSGLALATLGVVGFVGLIVLAVDPTFGLHARQAELGAAILAAFALPLVSIVATCLTLAYVLDCWPAFLRAKRIAAHYKIDAEGLSNRAMRGRMGQVAYWGAFLKGAVVAAAFLAPWIGAARAMSRKGFPSGLVGPAALLTVFAGGLSVKAWAVRRLVADRPLGPEGGLGGLGGSA